MEFNILGLRPQSGGLLPHANVRVVKAVVHDRYGPPEVLRIEKVDRPVPRDNEVLIKIRAAAVTRADCATREANRRNGAAIQGISRMLFGARRPRRRILGSEVAGEVQAVGGAIREFAVGEEVFGSTGFRFGGWAELTCIPENGRIAHKPAATSFEQAAAICDGGLYALWCLRQADLSKRHHVLIYGASGAIGTAGVQLAKAFGSEVTAVTSTKNLDLVRSIGADLVIDYTKEDFTKNGQTYDVVFDAVGKHSFGRSRGSLKHAGRYLATDGLANLGWGVWTLFIGDKKVKFSIQSSSPKRDVAFLKDLVESGKFRPVIDRCYPLEDVVEASRYVDTEQKVGNVVLQLTD